VYELGLIPNVMDLATTASVMWASLNGAFLLTGQDNIFREVTGLNPENFVERAFEYHLNAAQALAAHHSSGRANGHANGNGNGNGARAKARASHTKSRDGKQNSAATATA